MNETRRNEQRVALLFADRVAHARLSEALRGFATIRIANSADDVLATLGGAQAPSASVIFFAPSHQSEALRAADALHVNCPDHPVVGYVDPRSLSSQFILETGRANLTDLVMRDVDDSRIVLKRVLQNAEQQGSAAYVAEQMCIGLPGQVRQTVRYICKHLRTELDVPTIAAGLGLSRRTLNHRLTQAGSPAASELVGWCRVLFIAYQTATRGSSLATVASQLDVHSWRNLNYLLRRYLGVGATQLRHEGAFHDALSAFHGAFASRSPGPMRHWVEAEAPATRV